MPARGEVTRLTGPVTAYRRREFPREAVESAVRRSSGELATQFVVVKDFEDPQLDAYLDDSGPLPSFPEQRRSVNG